MSKKLFCILFGIGAFFLCIGFLGAIEFMLFETQFLFCTGAVGTIITILVLLICFIISELKE